MRLTEQLARLSADKIPRGWLDRQGLARAEGRPHGDGAFFYTIKHAVDAGLLETRQFRVASASGLRLVRHYRRTKRGASAKQRAQNRQ